MIRVIAATALLLVFPCLSAARAEPGHFTAAQASAGQLDFNNHCAECHRPDLTGALGPALTGKAFNAKWGGKQVSDLYAFEHASMPQLAPGSLADADYLAITAFILSRNGFSPGAEPLTTDDMKGLTLPK